MYEIYRKLRDEKKCKDADVAKATGITKSTFSDWKSGRSKPKDEKLKKIAEFFGVSVDYLTGHQPIVVWRLLMNWALLRLTLRAQQRLFVAITTRFQRVAL